VPAYSALRDKIGRSRIHFATTLSIHNTSPDKNLILERVHYRNTEGELVQEYLERAVALKPYGTIELFVSRDDLRGGTSANFVVHWAAAEQTAKPIVEAVMIGSTGAATYSFVSHGRTVGISLGRVLINWLGSPAHVPLIPQERASADIPELPLRIRSGHSRSHGPCLLWAKSRLSRTS
jgi:hypothetical protein